MYIPFTSALPLILGLLFLAYCIYRAVIAYRNRPPIRSENIIYQEWTASGFSETNLLTRMDCIRLIVTQNSLIVTTWGPFLLFSAFYDLEHVIPLASLESIEVKKVMFHKYLRLTFRGDDGFISKICLAPNDPAAFLKAVGQRERAIG